VKEVAGVRECRVRVAGTGRVLAERVRVAGGLWERFRGLMLRRDLAGRGGMLFPRCGGVHTCFMLFELDLIYVDGAGRVLKVVRALRPWRLSWCAGADAVLELPAGRAGEVGLEAGDELLFEPSD